MSDMYEKLGDLLNNVLETGEISKEEIEKDQITDKNNDKGDESGSFFIFTKEKTEKNREKTKITIENLKTKQNTAQGKVYKKEDISRINLKMHKYTEKMHNQSIPLYLSKSLDTLHIVSLDNLNQEKLKQIYHDLLKKNHPDLTKQENSQNDTTDEIIKAYNQIKNYLKTL